MEPGRKLTLDELRPLFLIRPRGKYRRKLNIDRNGKRIRNGCTVNLKQLENEPIQQITLEYCASRHTWIFYTSAGQYYIMPTEYYPPTRVNVFHYCEVINEGK